MHMSDRRHALKVMAGAGVVAATGAATATAREPERALRGQWYYQSFVARPAEVDSSQTPPKVERPPLIAAPWTPRVVMELTTDADGKVTGSGTLGPFEVEITGAVTPAAGPSPDGVRLPAGVELVVTVKQRGATYNLRGYFLADSDHVVGTVVSLGNDLGFQPAGTSGPFVLRPVRS